MARISIFILVTLLFVGNQQTCHAEDSKGEKIVNAVLDFTNKGYDLAMDFISGNFIKAAFDIAASVKQLVGLYKKPAPTVDPNSAKFDAITKKLESIGKNIEDMQKNILAAILDAHPKKSELRLRLADFSEKIYYINSKFEEFIYYIAFPSRYTNETLDSFSRSITSTDSEGLIHRLQSLHHMFYNTDYVSSDPILNLMAEDIQALTLMCQRKQSHQQLVRVLYGIVLLTDVKGYLTLHGSYDLRQLFGAGDFEGEKDDATRGLLHRTMNMIQHVKPIVKHLSRGLWNCDSDFENNVTYTEMEGFIKRHILNEAYFAYNDACHTGGNYYCPEAAYYVTSNREHENLLGLDKVMPYAGRCDGSVHNCITLKDETDVCFNPDSRRRIMEPINNASKECSPKSHGYRTEKFTLNSFKHPEDFRDEHYTCHYCNCVCDFTGRIEADRYVSLRSVEADVTNNYTMTGIRFVKFNHILQLQIKEGKLLPGGIVDSKDNDWKSINHLEIDENTRENNKFLESNDDYHELRFEVPKEVIVQDGENNPQEYLDWSNGTYSAINLDDVDLYNLNENETKELERIYCEWDEDCADFHPAKHFIATGVKFRRTLVRASGIRLALGVRMTLFDFTTGRMYEDRSRYVYTESKPKERTSQDDLMDRDGRYIVDVSGYDVPTHMKFKPEPSYKRPEYVKFTTSSMDTDAGQTTLPLIDIQPVETEPPVLLSGVGLFHKSVNIERSGGFLAPKLSTFDYAPFML